MVLVFIYLSKKVILLLLILLLWASVEAFSQTNIANSSPSNLIIDASDVVISPGEMGPNALPVPEIFGGKIGDSIVVDMGGACNFLSGDVTYSSLLGIYFPVVNNKVAIQLWAVPFEYYMQKSDANAEPIEGRYTMGDIYVNTYFQITEGRRVLPDLVARIGIKTASGSGNEYGRFTDAPAYYFDLNFSKYFFKNHYSSLSLSGMAGFYCWQLLNSKYYQNDATLMGLSVDYKQGSVLTKASVRAYTGYIDNGDKPVVGRISFSFPLYHKISLEVEAEKGIHDFLYNGIYTRIAYTISH